MKKVVLSLAVLASVALVSCGDKKADATVDSDTMVVAEEVITDTVAVEATSDSTANVTVASDTTVVAGEVPAEAAK